MNFLNHILYLNESENMTYKIGYGVRDVKTHTPIKFFSILHFYSELQEFKKQEMNSDNLNSGKWKITNELKKDDSRYFEFWKSDKIYPITKNEPEIKLGKYKSEIPTIN